METLEYRYDVVMTILERLQESLHIITVPESERLHESLRDSVIQRFEYTIDVFGSS